MTQETTIQTAKKPQPAPVPVETRTVALIVDDNATDRRRLKSMCDQADLDLSFVEASSIAEMQAAMDKTAFNLIFIDYRLDDGDGLGALALIKRDLLNRRAATIMVAGVAQASIAVAALKSGCNDYILKDAMDPHWLRRAVTSAIETSRMKRVMDASEQVRTTLDTVLRGFSRECAMEMKPMLSRMLRQVRQLRGVVILDDNAPSSGADIDELEYSCNRLWNFVEGIERSAKSACDDRLKAN